MKSFKSFRLQYVGKGTGTCAAPSGGTPSSYTDVSSTTLIAYYNGVGIDGVALTANANDPTDGGNTIVNQTFNKSNPVTNAIATIPSGQDGKWDFSLKDNGSAASTAYCLRMVGLSSPLYTWGNASGQQLAQGYDFTTTITRITSTYYSTWNWKAISAGYYHVLAIRNDGTLWVWGQISIGAGSAFGNGEVGSTRIYPTQVDASTWSSVSGAAYGSMGIKTDGTLWGWGDNSFGQLGLPTPATSRIIPTQVGATTTWAKVQAAYYIGMALQSDGTLFVWGTNHDGQLGLGTATSSTVVLPTVLGTSKWIDITASTVTSAAIKADGTLWAWGDNGTTAWFGIATTTLNSLSPVQVGSSTNWKSFRTGDCNSLAAIKTDGTLWEWGQNTSAQAVNGATSSLQITPTQVGSATNWQSATCLTNKSFGGIRTDGSLWVWGDNTTGLLASGATSSVLQMVPAQIGTSTVWSLISGIKGSQSFMVIAASSTVLSTYSSLPQVTTASNIQTLTFAVSTTTIYLGTFSSATTNYGSSTNTNGSSVEVQAHTLTVNTNAPTGFSLTVQGSTLSSTQNSAWTISPLLSNTTPSIGTAQFGIRMTASGGTGSVVTPYAAAGFAYTATATTSAQVGTDNVGDNATTTYSVRYMVNVAPLTNAGAYSGSFVYVATANF